MDGIEDKERERERGNLDIARKFKHVCGAVGVLWCGAHVMGRMMNYDRNIAVVWLVSKVVDCWCTRTHTPHSRYKGDFGVDDINIIINSNPAIYIINYLAFSHNCLSTFDAVPFGFDLALAILLMVSLFDAWTAREPVETLSEWEEARERMELILQIYFIYTWRQWMPHHLNACGVYVQTASLLHTFSIYLIEFHLGCKQFDGRLVLCLTHPN